MAAGGPTSQDDVFINCPFDDEYRGTFRALIFTLFACSFRPRSALELDDAGQARIDKLITIIRECRYGIHDLSRTELDAVNGLPRFNMPLELGLFLGARYYGGTDQKLKRTLVLDTERYRFQKFISHLAGMDIHEHRGDPLLAIEETRDWLANVSRRALPSAHRLQRSYESFRADLPEIAAKLGFAPNKIPYVDFELIVTRWLVQAAPQAAENG